MSETGNFPPRESAAMEPMPVRALSYGGGDFHGRPAIITAIGVTSIVIASISILTTGIFTLYSVGALVMSRMPATTATVKTSPSTAAAPGEVFGEDGIPLAKRN